MVVSGNVWSGQTAQPIGGIQFLLAPYSSGNAYIGLSGSLTITSGGMFLSGGGLSDGMLISPGTAYFIPKLKFPVSGQCSVWAWTDATSSGQARLFWETF